MFRFNLIVLCFLMFSIPSFAFFSEILQTAESMIQTHQKEIESGKKSAQEIASILDQDLLKLKEQARTLADKILRSGLVSPKFKETILQALSILEEEITHKIEDTKKLVEAKADL